MFDQFFLGTNVLIKLSLGKYGIKLFGEINIISCDSILSQIHYIINLKELKDN